MADDALFMRTTAGALVPCNEAAAGFVAGLKVGHGVALQFRKARNIRFHRKLFALLNLAFEHWEPEPVVWKGHAAVKSKDRFRKDILILSGHYNTVINVLGEVRLEPKSLSFASMDDEEFADVYVDVLAKCWELILQRCKYKSPEEVDRVVNELLSYD